MGRNVGSADQWLRLFLGTAGVVMWAFGPLGVWGLPGVYPLVTGITGVCPIYAVLGVSTARRAG